MKNKIEENEELILKLIRMSELSDAKNSIRRLEDYIVREQGFKIFLLDLMIEIERWGCQINTFIVPISLSEYIYSIFEALTDHQLMLWGIPVAFSTKIPETKILLIADKIIEQKFDSRFLALGIVDIDKIKRVEKLKSFW